MDEHLGFAQKEKSLTPRGGTWRGACVQQCTDNGARLNLCLDTITRAVHRVYVGRTRVAVPVDRKRPRLAADDSTVHASLSLTGAGFFFSSIFVHTK